MKHAARILLCILFSVSMLPWNLYSQDLSVQNKRKSKLEKEIQILDSQLKATDKKSASALSALSLTRKRIENRKALIRESDNEIAVLDRGIRELQSQVNLLKERIDTMSLYYNRLLLGAYKNRDARVWYMYILGSESLSQGLRRYSYLRNMTQEMNSQASRIIASKTELEKQSDSLSTMRQNAARLRNSRMKELSSLKADEAASQKLVDNLKRNKAKYQKELNKKKSEVQALNREISRIVAEYSKSSGKSGGKTKKNQAIDYKLGKEFSSNKGKLPWPAEGAITERFGTQYHPVYKTLKLPDSDGISIALNNDTAIKAVFEGEVKKVIVMQGYNKCVLIQHGEWFTFYCKLGQVNVKAGDKVKTGQIIGTVAAIGGITQLHFQLWSSKGPQDPLKWLRPQ